jgi:predicted DNA-binding transcriptional regulator AlpA
LLGKIGKVKLKLAKQIAEQILSLVKVREITKKKRDADPVTRPREEKIAVEDGRTSFKNAKTTRRLLSYSELVTRGIRYTRQHLHRLEASNKFPKRVKIGEHSIAWVESEIDEYLEKRIAERG